MRIIDYLYDKRCIDRYIALIGDLYRDYPLFARAKAEEARKAFNKENPFLCYGRWRNYLVTDRDRSVAHISAIVDGRLPSDVGLVGYFDAVKMPGCANEAFDAAIRYLAGEGRRMIRGPVNFTTWQCFRVSYPEVNPPFLLEPFTRGYYRGLFEGYGFRTAQKNISTISKIRKTDFDTYEKAYGSLKKTGFTFEAVDDGNLSSSLPEIHDLAMKIFCDSWSFVKISFKEFLYSFRDSAAAPPLLYVTRNKTGKIVAFLLGASDTHLDRGSRIVIKTMGVLPEYQKLGIARALFYLIYLKAERENASDIIFSTMRVDNRKIRELTGIKHNVYRRYSVYEMSI